jgi:6-phosphogluconolactonase (cycloisomerase 2 family)
MNSASFVRPAVALVILLSAAACGGGGGGGSTPAPNPPAPNPPAPNPPTPSSYTVGGTVTGLSGAGLVLQNNSGDNLAINGSGPFTFATPIQQGNAYSVTVLTQPGNPKQTCSVSNGSGSVGAGNVTSVAIACATDTFVLSAQVTGLTGSGLVISNGSDRITPNADGSFAFGTPVASGARYNVLIEAAPTNPAQRCTIANGNGTITNATVTVTIACTATFPTFAYNLNQGDGTLASYAIDATSGQMRPRFVAKTGATPVQLTTYRSASDKRFGYVANQGSDSVSAFTLDPRTGALTEVTGSPFTTGGTKPKLLTLHPTRPFIYAVNETSASISAYTINADTGVLTQVGPTATGSSPRSFSIEASGRFAYVAASGSGELITYSIDQTSGALTEVTNSRVAIGTSFGGLALERNGRFVYAFDSSAGTIAAFAIDATTGAPTALTGNPIAAGSNITVLGTHPNGRFVYARRGPQNQTAANGVLVFGIDETTGAIGEIAGSPFDVGANPQAIAFDATGRNMYAGHLLVQAIPEINVRAYSVNPDTGALTVIGGSPFASPQSPAALDVDATGKFLYVANTQSNQLTTYSINSSDGSLSQIAGSPNNTGASPNVVMTDEDTTPVSLSSKFVYVTDPAGSVRTFNIGADGTLSAGTVPTAAATAPLGITLDPQGRFAYVADSTANAVRIFAVDASTGTLTEIAASAVSTTGSPQYVAIEPTGRYAYVSIPGAPSIVKYTIDANTGALSSPVPKTLTDDVQDLAITPNGRWLIATAAAGTTVYGYNINASTGELGTEVALNLGSGVATGSLAVDSSGKFAYITDTANAELRQVRISATALTGALSPVGVPVTYDASRVPTGIAVDRKGSFAFTADSSGNTVTMLGINSVNGQLTSLGSVAAGTNPIAITTDYSGDFVRVTTGNGELITFRVNRDTPSLTLVDTETGIGTIAEPATIVTSSHAE